MEQDMLFNATPVAVPRERSMSGAWAAWKAARLAFMKEREQTARQQPGWRAKEGAKAVERFGNRRFRGRKLQDYLEIIRGRGCVRGLGITEDGALMSITLYDRGYLEINTDASRGGMLLHGVSATLSATIRAMEQWAGQLVPLSDQPV